MRNIISDTVGKKKKKKLLIVLLWQNRVTLFALYWKEVGDDFRVLFSVTTQHALVSLLPPHRTIFTTTAMPLPMLQEATLPKKKMAVSQISVKWLKYCLVFCFCCQNALTRDIICIIHIMCHAILSCVWLSDPVDCSPPGSSVHGIFQARILEGVAISFLRGSSWYRDQTHVSHISYTVRWDVYHWAAGEAPYILYIMLLYVWDYTYISYDLYKN